MPHSPIDFSRGESVGLPSPEDYLRRSASLAGQATDSRATVTHSPHVLLPALSVYMSLQGAPIWNEKFILS